MGKKILRTVLSCVLLMLVLVACSNQADPSAAETLPESSKPDSVNQESEPVAEPEMEEEPPVSVEAEAVATTVGILVNGNKVGIGAYNIDGSNYVSIRDLAYVLDGSRASFDVGWDAATKSIALTSGQAYTPNGSELAENSGGKVSAWSIVTPVLLNGEEKMLDGYTVGNVSYFSLKDMSEVLDFSMCWFDALRYIVINTEKSYGEEPLTLEEEYQLIIDSRAVYAPAIEGLCEASPGLCYADYIDEKSTFLLISIGKNEYESTVASFEIYGPSEGHAIKYGAWEEDLYADGKLGVSLCEHDSDTFIKTSNWHGAPGVNPTQSYYTVKDKTLVLADKVNSVRVGYDLDGNLVGVYYSLTPEKEITKEEFDSIVEQYTKTEDILGYDWKLTLYNSGILPATVEPSISVNGQNIELDTELYGENGCVMAPMCPVLEKMGVAVCADSNLATIIASTKKDTLAVRNYMWHWGEMGDEYYMTFNDAHDTSAQGSMALRMVNGQMIVPIDYVAELFGAHCSWDDESRTLSITSSIPAEDRMSSSEVSDMVNFTLEDAECISEQYGYRFIPHPEHEWDAGGGYTNGRSYWWLCTLPATISQDHADALFFNEGIDLYEYVTIWNDGTMTVK